LSAVEKKLMLDTNFKRGCLAVFGCTVVQISVGELNLLGFLYPYMTSYFRKFDPQLTVDDLKLIPTFWVLAQIVSCPLGICVFGKIGIKPTFCLFITTFCLVHWLSSYITNYQLFAVIYGISGGTSQGALLILPIYYCWRYFPAEYKPTISGIVLSAYALSPLFTSYLALYTVNPGNIPPVEDPLTGKKYFPDEVADQFPYFLRLFGVVCFILGIGGTFLVWEPLSPEDELKGNEYEMALLDSQLPKDLDHAELKTKREAIESKRRKQLQNQISNIAQISLGEAKELFNQPDFRTLYLVMVIGFIFPHMMNFSFKSIGLAKLRDDHYVTMVGSIGAIVNALSRLVVGLAFQNFGYRVVGLSILGISIVTSLLYLPCANNSFTYLIATILFEITYGGQLGLYPLVSDRLFKDKGAATYSYLYNSFTFSLIFSLNMYTYTKTWFGEFAPFLIVAILASCAYPFVIKVANTQEEGEKHYLQRASERGLQ
jgi:Major Facilitator Superfamily